MEPTPTPPSIFKIIVKSTKLLFKNFNLLLLFLLTSFLRSYPFPFHSIDHDNPNKWTLILDYFISTLFTGIIPIISFILSCIIPIITIHALSSNNNATPISIKDLLLCRLPGGLKPSIITTFYVRVVRQAFLSFVGSPSESSNIADPDSIIPAIPNTIQPLLGIIYHQIFDTVFAVSLTISAVEDGCCGLKAIFKAMEVLSWRTAAMLIASEMVMVQVVDGIYKLVVFNVTAFRDPVAATVAGVVYMAAIFIEEVFELAASVVFYCEWQRTVNAVDVDDDGVMYESIPTAPDPQHERIVLS